MALHTAVARSGVRFVDATNVKININNNKSHFLQMTVFHVLIKLLRKKGCSAKKFIAYSLTVKPSCLCSWLILDRQWTPYLLG